MLNNNLIISGSSGFIGTNLLNYLQNQNIYRVKKDKSNEEIYFLDSLNNKINKLESSNNFTFIHLATFFTKDISLDKFVYESNYQYGKKILNKLENINLEKIIYTNSMYCYYPDSKTRELQYTKSKLEFSDYLNKYCVDKKISYEEIFLDNTYGPNDSRDKILPNIVKSILNFQENPILNPNNLVNLIHVNDVVSQLIDAANRSSSYKYAMLNKKSILLISIYEYLNEYFTKGIANKHLLKYSKNNYLEFPFENIFETKDKVKDAEGLLELINNVN